jgi:DNA polymerase I-like protein with 3'-5' exonuclease and polymerase domains
VYTLGFQSGCQKLIDDIKDGLDLHSLSLSGALGLPYTEVLAKVKTDPHVEKLRKKVGKPITFGIQYGASVKTIAKNAEISERQAQKAVDGYYNRYPEIKLFFDQVEEDIARSAIISKKSDVNKFERKILKNSRRFLDNIELLPIKDWDSDTTIHRNDYPRHTGYYRSLTGRKYSYDSVGRISRGEVVETYRRPTIQNYCNQGFAEDIQCASGVSLFNFLLTNGDKVEMVNEIHDCKDFLINYTYRVEIIDKLVYHMTQGYKKIMKNLLGLNIDLDLNVDVEVGNNFGELELWD